MRYLGDSRSENEFTGTAIAFLHKPTDDLPCLCSSRAVIRAGGFKLDRSALTSSTPGPSGIAGDTAKSPIYQETVDAFEIGGKYSNPAEFR